MSRYHALDALRAAMMFLGIYLHAVVAYSPLGLWPYKPLLVTSALDYTASAIHVFRMPVFYVMAGFFSALLLQRYGVQRAMTNRFWRIVVPFAVGWMVIFPLVMFLAATAQGGWDRGANFISSGYFLRYASPIHLWFLEYLILLYLGAACVVFVLHFVLPPGAHAALRRLFRAAVNASWAPLPLAALSLLALQPMRTVGIDTPTSFAPSLPIFVAYAIPFAFGWLLFGHDDLLETLSRRAWFNTTVAVIACVAFIGLVFSPAGRSTAIQATRVADALAMWCFIFGITGLFVRYLSGYSALRRYLCDSSYFLYIAHVPVIVALQIFLKDVALPPLTKIFLVLFATIAILLPIYRYTVRSTFIGGVLNGRKYPPAFAPAAAAAE